MESERVITDPIQELQKIPKKELYRFIVDGQLHSNENGWLGYASREQNCLPAAYDALRFALTDLSGNDLSLNLIKKIHAHVAQDIKQIRTKPGKFRKNPGGYYLLDRVHNHFLNKEGFLEFYNFITQDMRQYGSCINVVDENFLAQAKSQEDFNERIHNLNQSLKSPDELWEEIQRGKILFYRAPHPKYLDELIENICHHFNDSIKHTENSLEKLKIIAATVQKVERIHPFSDANGRTSLILLQRLLVQNGFLPVMLYNPNYIDGYSIDTLVNEIIKGMHNTRKMILQSDDTLFGYRTEKIKDQRNFTQAPELRDPTVADYYRAENDLHQFITTLEPSHISFEQIPLAQETELDKKNTAKKSKASVDDNIRNIVVAFSEQASTRLKALSDHEDFRHDLVNAIKIYYKICHSGYDKAVGHASLADLMTFKRDKNSAQEAKKIKNYFINAVEMALPYLEKDDRERLQQYFSEMESNHLAFLKDHTSDRFYTRFIDTNSWKKLNALLNQPYRKTMK